jgi:hypothetical protein
MTETQIEEAERILSYAEAHVIDGAPHPDPSGRAGGFTLDDSVKLLRDMLPDWSAFKTAEVTR